jgi:hypothetical protein
MERRHIVAAEVDAPKLDSKSKEELDDIVARATAAAKAKRRRRDG